jgi:hypothetical protein
VQAQRLCPLFDAQQLDMLASSLSAFDAVDGSFTGT